VASFTWWRLLCMSFFEIFEGVEVMVVVMVAGWGSDWHVV